MIRPISLAALSSKLPILPRRGFITRRNLIPRSRTLGSISPVPILDLSRRERLHCTYETKVPVQLRRLRKIAEETKNHDLERDLYIEERKAERGVYWHQLVEELKKAPEELKKKLKDIEEQQREVWSNSRHRARARSAHVLGIAVKIARLFTHLLWIVVMGVYWALADYGRSFIRPAVALGLSVWLFHFGYAAILAPLTPQAGTLDVAKYARAVGMVAIGNAVPFVGPLTIDAEIKKFLFCASNAALASRQFRRKAINCWCSGKTYFRSSSFFSSASRCAIISGSSDTI